jgi:hypothetical protein
MSHNDNETVVLESEEFRPMHEIVAVSDELREKVWYNRHLVFEQNVRKGRETCDPEIMAQAIRQAKKLEQKYGRENLGPYPDFDWGMMCGKLSALHWLLGNAWEESLDT